MGLSTQFQYQIDNGILAHEQLKEKPLEQQNREYAAGVAFAGDSMLSKGSLAGLISSEKITAEEKQKKDREDMAQAIEQQRQIMLGQLDAAISDLSEEIERDQETLAALEKKKSALTEINKLQDAKKFDTDKPDHLQLVDDAGFDKEKFVNSSAEEQEAAVDAELGITETKITQLVNKISADMDRLDLLAQAKTDLGNGADPNKVNEYLNGHGIELSKLSEGSSNIASRISMEKIFVNQDINKDNAIIKTMDSEELTELIKVAKNSGLSDKEISLYEDELASRQDQTASPGNVPPNLGPMG